MPSGVKVEIFVDERGLALLDPETGAQFAFYSLFDISGWGATNEKLHLVVAEDTATGRDKTFEIWTQSGRDVIVELKRQAHHMVAQVQGAQPDNSAPAYQKQAGGSISPMDSVPRHMHGGPQLGDDQYLGDDDEMGLGDIGFEISEDGLTPPPQEGYDARIDDMPLPENWTKEFSKSSGDYYFFNAHTGESIWEHPLAGQQQQQQQQRREETVSGHQPEPQQTHLSKFLSSEMLVPQETVGSADPSSPAGWGEVVNGHLELRGHSATVHALWVYPADEAGQLVASGSDDNSLRLWCLTKNTAAIPAVEQVISLTEHSGNVRALRGVACCPHGVRWLASGATDHLIVIWAEEGFALWKAVATLRGHDDGVTALDVIGNTLVSGDDAGSIRVWNAGMGVKSFLDTGPPKHDISDWQCTARLETGKGRWISALTSIDDGAVASCEDDGTIRIWGVPIPDPNSMDELELVTQPKPVHTLAGHKQCVWSLDSYAWKGETKLLASASSDKTIRLWTRQAFVEHIEDSGQQDVQPVWSCALTVRGAHLRRSVPHALVLIDSTVEQPTAAWEPTLVFNRLKIASGGSDGRVTLWKLKYEHQEGLDWWDYERLATVSMSHAAGSGCVNAVLPLFCGDCVVACGHSDSVTISAIEHAESLQSASVEADQQNELVPAPAPAVHRLELEESVLKMASMAQVSSDSESMSSSSSEDHRRSSLPPLLPSKAEFTVSAASSQQGSLLSHDVSFDYVEEHKDDNLSCRPDTQAPLETESIASGGFRAAKDADTSSDEVEVMATLPVASKAVNPSLPILDLNRLQPSSDQESLVPPLLKRDSKEVETKSLVGLLPTNRLDDMDPSANDCACELTIDELASGVGSQLDAAQSMLVLPKDSVLHDAVPTDVDDEVSSSLDAEPFNEARLKLPQGTTTASLVPGLLAAAVDPERSDNDGARSDSEASLVTVVSVSSSGLALAARDIDSSSDDELELTSIAQVTPRVSVPTSMAAFLNSDADAESSSDDSEIELRRPPQVPSSDISAEPS